MLWLIHFCDSEFWCALCIMPQKRKSAFWIKTSEICGTTYITGRKNNKYWFLCWILIRHPRGPLQCKFEGSRSIRSRVIAKKPKNGPKWPKNEVFYFPYIFLMVWPTEFKLGQLTVLKTSFDLTLQIVQNMATRRSGGRSLEITKSRILLLSS